jgi:hypothetical protein
VGLVFLEKRFVHNSPEVILGHLGLAVVFWAKDGKIVALYIGFERLY